MRSGGDSDDLTSRLRGLPPELGVPAGLPRRVERVARRRRAVRQTIVAGGLGCALVGGGLTIAPLLTSDPGVPSTASGPLGGKTTEDAVAPDALTSQSGPEAASDGGAYRGNSSDAASPNGQGAEVVTTRQPTAAVKTGKSIAPNAPRTSLHSTKASGTPGLTCPSSPTYGGPPLFKPGPAKQLVPKAVPPEIVVCGYVGSGPSSKLARSRKARDGLAELTAAWSVLPPSSESTCDVATSRHFLVAFRYGERVIWVDVSEDRDGCGTASNGAFRTDAALLATTLEAYSTGVWKP